MSSDQRFVWRQTEESAQKNQEESRAHYPTCVTSVEELTLPLWLLNIYDDDDEIFIIGNNQNQQT